MKRKTNKKETVVSVLLRVKKKLDQLLSPIIFNDLEEKYLPKSTVLENLLGKDFINLEDAPSPGITEKELNKIIHNNQILIYIPEITAKELVENCGNKTTQGKLLYDTEWYEKENFYTTEKSRKGWYSVSKFLLDETRNKTWNEQEEILKRLGAYRLNFSEVLYIIYAYEKQNKEYLLSGYNYCWTSSRVSDGRLVYVGGSGSAGAGVHGNQPDNARSRLGVSLSRRMRQIS